MIGLFNRLKQGLTKTRDNILTKIKKIITPGKKIDDGLIEELEEVLISADIGAETASNLLNELKKEAKREGIADSTAVISHLKKKISAILKKLDTPNKPLASPLHIILIVGVNGSGKTTTIGKLAAKYIKDGKKVIIAAGDTFRAAAADQLEIWAKRAGAEIIKHKSGADPSGVVFDAVSAASARGYNILIVDTAGRLHTKSNLMEELKKIKKVISGKISNAPHETLLVLDAGLGQNAVIQAKEFKNAIDITGLVLAKLDGTAKGGVVINIAASLNLPVKYVGLGEDISDLTEFNPDNFVEAILGE